MRYAMNRSHNTSAAQALYDIRGHRKLGGLPVEAGRRSRPHQRQRLRPGAGQCPGSSMIETGGGLRRGGQPRANIWSPTPSRSMRELGRHASTSTLPRCRSRRQVFKESTAWMLVDVLKGCVSSGVGTGSRANFGGMDRWPARPAPTPTNVRRDLRGHDRLLLRRGVDRLGQQHARWSPAPPAAAPPRRLWAAIMDARCMPATGCTTNREIIGRLSFGLRSGSRARCCARVRAWCPPPPADHDANGLHHQHRLVSGRHRSRTRPSATCIAP